MGHQLPELVGTCTNMNHGLHSGVAEEGEACRGKVVGDETLHAPKFRDPGTTRKH
jgi:hypothetical protein